MSYFNEIEIEKYKELIFQKKEEVENIDDLIKIERQRQKIFFQSNSDTTQKIPLVNYAGHGISPICSNFPDMDKLYNASMGWCHMLFIDNICGIFAIGSNKHGQLEIPPGLNKNTRKIQAGGTFSAALTNKGKIVLWGNLRFLSAKHNFLEIHDQDYLDIWAGFDCFIALKKDGTLKGFGKNKKIVQKVSSLREPTGKKVTWPRTVSIGKNHAALITKFGDAVVWGDNSHKQCDVPESSIVSVTGPFSIFNKDGSLRKDRYCEDLVSSPYTDIEVGDFHTITLTQNGVLQTWGIPHRPHKKSTPYAHKDIDGIFLSPYDLGQTLSPINDKGNPNYDEEDQINEDYEVVGVSGISEIQGGGLFTAVKTKKTNSIHIIGEQYPVDREICGIISLESPPLLSRIQSLIEIQHLLSEQMKRWVGRWEMDIIKNPLAQDGKLKNLGGGQVEKWGWGQNLSHFGSGFKEGFHDHVYEPALHAVLWGLLMAKGDNLFSQSQLNQGYAGQLGKRGPGYVDEAHRLLVLNKDEIPAREVNIELVLESINKYLRNPGPWDGSPIRPDAIPREVFTGFDFWNGDSTSNNWSSHMQGYWTRALKEFDICARRIVFIFKGHWELFSNYNNAFVPNPWQIFDHGLRNRPWTFKDPEDGWTSIRTWPINYSNIRLPGNRKPGPKEGKLEHIHVPGVPPEIFPITDHGVGWFPNAPNQRKHRGNRTGNGTRILQVDENGYPYYLTLEEYMIQEYGPGWRHENWEYLPPMPVEDIMTMYELYQWDRVTCSDCMGVAWAVVPCGDLIYPERDMLVWKYEVERHDMNPHEYHMNEGLRGSIHDNSRRDWYRNISPDQAWGQQTPGQANMSGRSGHGWGNTGRLARQRAIIVRDIVEKIPPFHQIRRIFKIGDDGHAQPNRPHYPMSPAWGQKDAALVQNSGAADTVGLPTVSYIVILTIYNEIIILNCESIPMYYLKAWDCLINDIVDVGDMFIFRLKDNSTTVLNLGEFKLTPFEKDFLKIAGNNDGIMGITPEKNLEMYDHDFNLLKTFAISNPVDLIAGWSEFLIFTAGNAILYIFGDDTRSLVSGIPQGDYISVSLGIKNAAGILERGNVAVQWGETQQNSIYQNNLSWTKLGVGDNFFSGITSAEFICSTDLWGKSKDEIESAKRTQGKVLKRYFALDSKYSGAIAAYTCSIPQSYAEEYGKINNNYFRTRKQIFKSFVDENNSIVKYMNEHKPFIPEEEVSSSKWFIPGHGNYSNSILSEARIEVETERIENWIPYYQGEKMKTAIVFGAVFCYWGLIEVCGDNTWGQHRVPLRLCMHTDIDGYIPIDQNDKEIYPTRSCQDDSEIIHTVHHGEFFCTAINLDGEIITWGLGDPIVDRKELIPPTDIVCQTCGIWFSNDKEYQDHMALNHNNEEYNFYENYDYFKENDLPMLYSLANKCCWMCENENTSPTDQNIKEFRKFDSILDLKKHIRDVHGISQIPDERYSCCVCSRKFNSKKEMQDHIKKDHYGNPLLGINYFKCPQCGIYCSDLRAHYKNYHMQPIPDPFFLEMNRGTIPFREYYIRFDFEQIKYIPRQSKTGEEEPPSIIPGGVSGSDKKTKEHFPFADTSKNYTIIGTLQWNSPDNDLFGSYVEFFLEHEDESDSTISENKIKFTTRTISIEDSNGKIIVKDKEIIDKKKAVYETVEEYPFLKESEELNEKGEKLYKWQHPTNIVGGYFYSEKQFKKELENNLPGKRGPTNFIEFQIQGAYPAIYTIKYMVKFKHDYGQTSPPEGKLFTDMDSNGYTCLALKAISPSPSPESNPNIIDKKNGPQKKWNNYNGYTSSASRTELIEDFEYECINKPIKEIVWWGKKSELSDNIPPPDQYHSISVGCCHAIVLKCNGEVIVWGCKKRNIQTTKIPVTIEEIESGHLEIIKDLQGKVRYIEAGCYNTAVICDTPPPVSMGFCEISSDSLDSNIPDEVKIDPKEQYLQVEAGMWNTGVIDNNNNIKVWGWGEYGLNDPPPDIQGQTLEISLGSSHALALLKDKKTVIGWGKNDKKQIEKIEANSDIIKVSAGGKHSLALTMDGDVFAWGDNSFGQINIPKGKKFIDIEAKNHSTWLVDEVGMLLKVGLEFELEDEFSGESSGSSRDGFNNAQNQFDFFKEDENGLYEYRRIKNSKCCVTFKIKDLLEDDDSGEGLPPDNENEEGENGDGGDNEENDNEENDNEEKETLDELLEGINLDNTKIPPPKKTPPEIEPPLFPPPPPDSDPEDLEIEELTKDEENPDEENPDEETPDENEEEGNSENNNRGRTKLTPSPKNPPRDDLINENTPDEIQVIPSEKITNLNIKTSSSKYSLKKTKVKIKKETIKFIRPQINKRNLMIITWDKNAYFISLHGKVPENYKMPLCFAGRITDGDISTDFCSFIIKPTTNTGSMIFDLDKYKVSKYKGIVRKEYEDKRIPIREWKDEEDILTNGHYLSSVIESGYSRNCLRLDSCCVYLNYIYDSEKTSFRYEGDNGYNNDHYFSGGGGNSLLKINYDSFSKMSLSYPYAYKINKATRFNNKKIIALSEYSSGFVLSEETFQFFHGNEMYLDPDNKNIFVTPIPKSNFSSKPYTSIKTNPSYEIFRKDYIYQTGQTYPLSKGHVCIYDTMNHEIVFSHKNEGGLSCYPLVWNPHDRFWFSDISANNKTATMTFQMKYKTYTPE